VVLVLQRIATMGPSWQLISIKSWALAVATTSGMGSRGNIESNFKGKSCSPRTSEWMRSTGMGRRYIGL